MTDRERRLLACLAEARRIGNQTVTDTYEVARNHREMDHLLIGTEFDDAQARYDAPHRVERRAFIDSLFRYR